jgi:tRNA pseudouridine55 synthase
LARDIGEALGSGAYLTRLTRTRVGDFKIEECIRPEDFSTWLKENLTEENLTEL